MLNFYQCCRTCLRTDADHLGDLRFGAEKGFTLTPCMQTALQMGLPGIHSTPDSGCHTSSLKTVGSHWAEDLQKNADVATTKTSGLIRRISHEAYGLLGHHERGRRPGWRV